jgi:ADP-L-glycero-D-manno-heptose 6-epimerase
MLGPKQGNDMIIVTGANGFIGSALVWELNQAGRTDIVCVDSVSLAERNVLKKSTYSSFMLKDEIWAFLNEPRTIASVEAILHMGACSSTTELNVEFLNENNVEYTRRLWQWCTEHKKTFVYASSGAVYGDGAEGFDDATPPSVFKPLNPYGESKAAFDRWAVQQKATPPLWLGLRFFNVFGPNEYHKESMRSVVCKAFQEITDTGRLRLFRSHNPSYADGQQLRDFVYVKDITRWILELLKAPPARQASMCGIFNMGFGKARTWLDLAGAVFGTMGKPLQIDWVDIPVEMRPRYQYYTQAKIDRLMALGLSTPQWPLERAVEDYVKNYLMKTLEGKDGLLDGHI